MSDGTTKDSRFGLLLILVIASLAANVFNFWWPNFHGGRLTRWADTTYAKELPPPIPPATSWTPAQTDSIRRANDLGVWLTYVGSIVNAISRDASADHGHTDRHVPPPPPPPDW